MASSSGKSSTERSQNPKTLPARKISRWNWNKPNDSAPERGIYAASILPSRSRYPRPRHETARSVWSAVASAPLFIERSETEDRKITTSFLTLPQRYPFSWGRLEPLGKQIGRASCRERSVDLGG